MIMNYRLSQKNGGIKYKVLKILKYYEKSLELIVIIANFAATTRTNRITR